MENLLMCSPNKTWKTQGKYTTSYNREYHNKNHIPKSYFHFSTSSSQDSPYIISAEISHLLNQVEKSF